MENYNISIPHFYCIKYEDFNEKKSVLLEIDLRDKYKILSKESITRWEAPYQNEIISEEKKLTIINNVSKYLIKRFGKKNIINSDLKESRILFFLKYPNYCISIFFSNLKLKLLLKKKHTMTHK